MSEPEGKDRLVSELAIILRNFLLGQQFANHFAQDPTVDRRLVFSTAGGDVEQVDVESLYLDALTGSPIEPDSILRHFRRSLSRAALAESYEAILLYCSETSQIETYRATPFLQFARVLRNVTSHRHGGFLTQWPQNLKKKGVVEVAWQNRVIREDMVGERIGMTDPEVIRLLRDEIAFVKDRLQ